MYYPRMDKPNPIPTLVSNVQILSTQKGWSKKDFLAECVGKRICSESVARGIWAGTCRISVRTLNLLAWLFGVTFNDVIIQEIPMESPKGLRKKK